MLNTTVNSLVNLIYNIHIMKEGTEQQQEDYGGNNIWHIFLFQFSHCMNYKSITIDKKVSISENND